jgi:serine/threonine protein kinase
MNPPGDEPRPPSPAAPAAQPVPAAIQSFDKYLLVRRLAQGGMAELYVAKQVGAEGFERDVVIKVMLGHLSQSAEFVQMFLDEARLAAKLVHPNIVQIMDLGVADGRYFICMEYLAGEDLDFVIERCRQIGQKVPVPIAAKLILAACEGLEFAHNYQEDGVRVNLVHRDVSPSNILVTFQGGVKVVDFGIAKASSKLAQTRPGLLKGKLGYMSPEQARGLPLDGRSDLFSLGITFYELVTGGRVFDSDSEIGVLLSLMEQPVPPPSRIRPEVPPEIDRIIERALARKVEERYPNAGSMRAELETYFATVRSPTTTEVAHFMQALFGPNHVKQKVHIPSLKDLQQSGIPFLPAAGTSKAVIEPTLVRATKDLDTRSATVIEEAPSELRGLRLKPLFLGALLAFGCVALVGGGFWLFQRAHTPAVPVPGPVAVEATRPIEPPPVLPTPEAEAPTPLEAPEEPKPAITERRAARPLGRKDIARVLQRHGAKIIACGESHRALLPPDGMVKVLFTIQHSGAVKDARVTTESVAGSALGACLISKLSALSFPKNSNDPEMSIEQPLRFQ